MEKKQILKIVFLRSVLNLRYKSCFLFLCIDLIILLSLYYTSQPLQLIFQIFTTYLSQIDQFKLPMVQILQPRDDKRSNQSLANNLHRVLEGLETVGEVVQDFVLSKEPILHLRLERFSHLLELDHRVFLKLFDILVLEL